MVLGSLSHAMGAYFQEPEQWAANGGGPQRDPHYVKLVLIVAKGCHYGWIERDVRIPKHPKTYITAAPEIITVSRKLLFKTD